MAFADVIFWSLAVTAVAASLGVVLLKNVFRAALLLVVVLLAVAGFFVMMNAEFLAVVQVLIYAGAIAILIIFATMLTRDVTQGNLPNRFQLPAILLPGLVLAALTFVAIETQWNLLSSETGVAADTVKLVQANTLEGIKEADRAALKNPASADRSGLGDLLINDFVLPFEISAVLLLAAVIGALALVREQRT